MEFAGSSVWNRQSFVLDTSSADLKGTAPLSASIAPSFANPQSAWRSGESTSIVFVDAAVKNYQQLVAGVKAGVEVHVLNPAQDAIAQITQTLLGRSGISSVHLVSHGEAGEIQLGNTLLTGSTLGTYAAQFKSWSQALTDDADILLYGCDVAQGEQGRAFIQQLSQLTGADIAASNNLTGSADAGGDWTLEVNTGKIAASIAFQSDTLAAYHGVLPVDLISVADPTLFSDSVGGYNGVASTSLDGRYVVFTSNATSLVSNDTNGASDVFLFDRTENTVKLISHQTGSNSAFSATGSSFNPIISSNGNYVAFTSTANDLVSTNIQNTSSKRNIFIWDRQSDSTTLVSHTTGGLSGDGTSSGYSISATGDAIAFVSQAKNLNALDANTLSDVYLWTQADNKVALVSRNATKTGSSDLGAGSAVLSSDGSYVAFTSNSTNLIANDPDPNQSADVFLWQRSTDPINDNSVLIAVTTGGNVSGTPSIASGGNRIAFVSNNAITGANDTNNLQDVFVWTRSTIDPTKGTIQLVSANSGGNGGTTINPGFSDGSFRPVISDNGSYVAFTSTASDLVADDTNGKKDVFVRDLTQGTTVLASRDSTGIVGDNDSDYASLSQTGKRVSFISSATNLVSNDTNGTQDVFVRDITTNSTFLISRTPSSVPGNNASGSSSAPGNTNAFPVISGDGNFVVFNSAASDLIANDGDGVEDVFITAVDAGKAALATRRNTGSTSSKTGSGDSTTSPGASVSADGRYVVFTSKAPELVANDANGAQDVFLRDVQTGQTTLISRNSAGTGSAAGDSINPQISADGRYIVFSSTASNIVANDGNAASDVFWYDRQNNKMVLVSHPNGNTATANGASLNPVLSADGLYVAFVSSAANLTGDTTNGKQNIFIWDSNTDTTTLVSHIGSSGGNGNSDSPVISSDGQYVAFASVASDLTGSDTNGRKDVFVWNRTNNTVTLVSQNTAGTIGDGDSLSPSISSNGRVIAFVSSATNLGGGTDTNAGQDIFVRNLDANTTTLVSVNTSNTYSAGGGTALDRLGAFNPVISGNGGFVAFSSTFTDLVTNDNNTAEDVFVRDLTNNTTQLASITSLGDSGTGTSTGTSGTGTGSSNPVISSDGRFVGFSSYSNNLVSGDTNGFQDVFVRDLTTASTAWISRDFTDTTGGNSASLSPVISSTGNYLAFTSNASNLIDADFNSKLDVFGTALTTVVSLTAANKQVAESGGTPNPTYEIRRSRTSGPLTIKLKIDPTSTATIAASVGAIADFTPTLDAGSFTISGSDLIITMPDGVGVVTLTLTPQDDIQAEADEFVKLALAADPAYSLSTGANADSVTILANDTVVTTTNDSGEGSLRQAILNANAFAGQDTISFKIPGGGVETISLASALPDITDSVIIDGTTQPGYTTTPIVELNGAGAGNANGLRITAGNSTVKGLIINRFSQNGIRLETNGNNIIQGNYLGTDSNGGSTVGNLLDGISIASSNNTIGGTTPVVENIIANNQGAGVTIEGNVAGNRIQGNAIFSNAGLGIDLGKDGVTPNDPGDADVGANGLQNTAVLTIAEPVGTNTVVSGTFDGAASSTFRVEFFSSTTADASGSGEGETFLGTTDITTDATGKASINYTYAGTVAAGQFITATITDSNGNTSEFSNAHVVGVPKVTISPTALSHQEGNQGATTGYTFTIGLDQASSQEVQVQVSTSDGTASSASDYTSLNQTVTFAPGETAKTVTVNVIGDNVKEPDETFNVSLSNVVNAELGTDATAIATILDDDNPPAISIANITPATVTEGDSGTTAYSFEVKLSNATSDPVTVSYATADGSATTSDNDYTAVPATTLTFAPGETSKTITVLGNGDTKFEQDEDFTVALSNPSSNASIATATALGLIKNDDQGSTISISAVSQVDEGAEGTTTDYVFTATLDKPSGEVVTVKYTTEDGSATTIDNDYVATTNILTFAPNTTTQTFTVKVNGDRKFEDDEQFKVVLSEPTNGSVSLTQGSAIATIKNDDVAPIIAITAPASFPEGNTGVSQANFVVSLADPSGKPVTVDYSTTDGTALAGEDYTAQLNQTLTFAPGETQKTIAIDVLGDTKRENDETFSVKLTSATGATLPDPNGISATATIQNDDQPPAISIVNTTQNQLEGDSGTINPNTFDITLSNASDQVITVQYDALNGNLAQGANATLEDNDFEATTGTVTFNPGETKKTVTVNVKGDANKEQDESYLVKLSNVSSSATIATDTAIGVIQNDDGAPAISITDASVVEGNVGQTALKFTVSLSSTSIDPITVNYSTSDGTATLADNDYASVSNATLTFAPGEISKDITIFVNGDTKLESDEGFNLTLSNPTNATIATATAIGTIKNDDTQPTISLTAPAKLEGNTTNPFSFVVSLSNATDKSVTVNYSTEDGTALAGEDYTAQLNQTLTFAPGETQKTLAIDVLGDTKRENDETFSVRLTSATDATIPDPNGIIGTATIQNDDQPPAISIANTTQNQLEGASGTINPNTFDITLSNPSDQIVTVQYDALNGNLTQGANATIEDNDFEATTGTVTFNPGETKKTVTVNVKGDANKEQDESYLVKLSNVSSSATIATDTAIGVIQNDDGAPAISITDASVVEGDSGQTALKFKVTLSGTSIDPITVNYSTSDGTATLADNDYTSVSNATLTFAPGETSKDVTVFVNGDTKLESDEGFNLTLSNPTNATIATATAIGTIKNDDRRPTLGISGVSKGEGNSGTQNYVFTVTLSNASSDVITVDYQTQDDTATIADGDYLQQIGKLTFNPGDPLQQQITVQVQGDNKFEPTEKFTVNLLNQSVVNADIAVNQADGIIINDDSQPTLSLSGRQSHTEGNSGTTPFAFDVNLSNPSSDVITVKYDTIPGTATSDVDYISASGTLTFNPGEQKKTITILGIGDTTVEPDEDFILRLSAPTNAILPSNATDAQGVIQNDDQPPFPTISIDDATTSEGNTGTTTALKFKVKLSQATTIPVTVQYATSDGTATTSDSDYIGIPTTTLTFAPGETEKEVAVTVNGDNKFEASEIFNVTLSNPTNAGLSTIAQQAKGTISNDDAKPTLSINTVADSEGDTGLKDFVFTVALSNPTADTVQVNYDTIDGTALVSDNDYQRATGTLTFAPGGPLTQSVAVKVVGDRKFEPNETFTVSLKNPQNADLSTIPNQGIGTITADDFRPTLSIQNDQKPEGNSGTTPLTFTVGLSNPSSETITVQYTTKPGTADTTDYTPSTGTLTFAPNEVAKTITVQALGDTQYELDETFTVELSNPDKALLPSSGTTLSATGTIQNDDPVPQLQVTAPAPQPEGNSGITPFVFEVTLSQASPVPVTVSYTTADGQATIADNDYTQAAGTLTFNPGEVKKTVTVNVLGDTRTELNETFQFQLSSPTNATIATNSTVTDGTIENDDINPNNQVNRDSKTDIAWRNARTGEDSIWYLSNNTYDRTIALPAMTEAGWRVRATADFDNDGDDDVLWQNDLTSAVRIWTMENSQVVKDTTLSIVPGLNWKIMGAADFNRDHKADIVWRNSQTGENVIWLMDGSTFVKDAYFQTVADQSWKMQQFGDFDNDGDTDILWRNINTGETHLWQMQDTQLQASFALPTVTDLTWKIEGVGDFTGDGILDILWRNDTTSANVIWQTRNFAFERDYAVKPVTDRGWDIERVTDFNGDHNVDILWRNHLTGENVIWYMNRTNFGVGLYLPLISDPGWNTVLIGDFNKDHTQEILYHNDLTQESMIWQLNPSLFIRSAPFVTVSDTNWVIDLSGDFNRDGEADLLWRNVRSGEMSISLMKNGAPYANGFYTQFSDPAWTAEAAADFDGDGNLDILWRNHHTGEVSVWKMDGAFRSSSNYLIQVADLDWEIVGVKDFNRDRKPDILWHNRRTGQTDIWLMNGFQYVRSVSLQTVDNHWHIKGIADFNIDNQPDLLWRNDQTGETVIWVMNDTQLSFDHYLPATRDTAWDIYAVRDFGGDGLTDILWRNNQTGDNVIWFLNGIEFGLDSYLPPYVDPDWHIEAVDDFKDNA